MKKPLNDYLVTDVVNAALHRNSRLDQLRKDEAEATLDFLYANAIRDIKASLLKGEP